MLSYASSLNRLYHDFAHVPGLQKDCSVLDKYSSKVVRHLRLFLYNNSCRIIQQFILMERFIFKVCVSLRPTRFVDIPSLTFQEPPPHRRLPTQSILNR
jgi:hypothetical protein